MISKKTLACTGLLTGTLLFNSPTNAIAPYEYKPVENERFSPVLLKIRKIDPIYDNFVKKVHLKPKLTQIRIKSKVLVKKTHHIAISGKKNAQIAKKYALSRLGPTQFSCLDKLFTRESHWRWNARNSSSGAYGIPQALPGSKMAKAGSDWRTNPITQVKWGLMYINSRYGSACGAWSHSQRTGWY